MKASGRILLTGASGYIGSRLLRELVRHGYRVRCLSRHPPTHLDSENTQVEWIQADLSNEMSLFKAMTQADAAYYLVHSMAQGANYADTDRANATHFAQCARRRNIKRIIYLGGLAHSDEPLSPHLTSRLEVGSILRHGSVPTLEFRASIVIGSQSVSFELLRALVERLPVMVAPRWVHSRAQPIAISDVLKYLIAAVTYDLPRSLVVEIGGSDVCTYGQLMQKYASVRHLRRVIIPVHVLTPTLSAWWLGLITPRYAQVGRQLVESLRCDTTVRDPSALARFSIKPMGIGQAIRNALKQQTPQRSPSWRNWTSELLALMKYRSTQR